MPRLLMKCAIIVSTLSAGLAASGAIHALDLGRYTEQERVGEWLILCETEEDMGGIYVFDCVVRSLTTPSLAVSSLTGTPAVSRADSVLEGRLALGAETIDLSVCQDGLCPLPVEAGALAELFDGDLSLETETGSTAISPQGFSDAVDRAIALID